MRLIDIDDISLRKTIACGGLSAKALWRRIQQQPTIDAVEVVRCRDCKHREKYPCGEIEFYECSHLRLYGTKVGVEDDWFCADGERKECK